MPDAKPTIDELKAIERLGGDRLFAFFIVAVSVCLLALIFDQTQWKNGKALLSQPVFWPGLSLVGMVICAAVYLVQSLRARHYSGWERRESCVWLRCLEFPFWFMAYVFAVPVVGYLPATMVFCPLLARRMGYADRATLLWATAMGAIIVILFKSFLQVRVPGGALYEYLPGAFRNFMILYL